jgi:hypothetical protein
MAEIAVFLLTVYMPLAVPPNRKLNALPTQFCGLSRERNSPFNRLIGFTSANEHKKTQHIYAAFF